MTLYNGQSSTMAITQPAKCGSCSFAVLCTCVDGLHFLQNRHNNMKQYIAYNVHIINSNMIYIHKFLFWSYWSGFPVVETTSATCPLLEATAVLTAAKILCMTAVIVPVVSWACTDLKTFRGGIDVQLYPWLPLAEFTWTLQGIAVCHIAVAWGWSAGGAHPPRAVATWMHWQ